MKVRIWFELEGDEPWVVTAWDEQSIECNPEGCQADVAKHPDAKPLDVTIPDEAIQALFDVPVVDGEVG